MESQHLNLGSQQHLLQQGHGPQSAPGLQGGISPCLRGTLHILPLKPRRWHRHSDSGLCLRAHEGGTQGPSPQACVAAMGLVRDRVMGDGVAKGNRSWRGSAGLCTTGNAWWEE